jgi:Zn-dependent oligopeptidase
MRTLFHEGGHAAHFANIVTDAPCFSQEMAPTSVAFAETQSMFLDSLLTDGAWQRRYATNADGEPIPFELIERSIALAQPAAAFEIRRMLTVCYFEKALYELQEEEVTPERVLGIVAEVERRLLFFPEGSPRPTLSVPHILSGDSSCYYHGYVLAQMAVAQTRAHFLGKYGHILDNPKVGADLAEVYWRPGNAVRFLDYVRRLTGAPLAADSLVAKANRTIEEAIEQAHASAARLPEIPAFKGEVDLDLRLSVVHGSEIVVEHGQNFEAASKAFRTWVSKNWPAK